MRHIAVFSRLPGTRREAVAVARELGIPADSGDIRLGLAAGEHEVKTLDLTAYRYLHFATHGVLAEDVPYLRQPALVLSQAGDLRGEDGFLTVGEILSLRLQADLTVLSACQTGLGQEVTGEGVVGLTRAFLYAGTRAAVVSLWRVEDESTALLMTRFYARIGRGDPPGLALQRAKAELRADARFAHPFFWAAFLLYGVD
jgi:CHAT domain-containing protein